MKIRRFSVCILFMLLLCSAANVYAKDIKLIVEGEELKTDNPPVIMYDRVMLPVRAIFEGVGAELAWNGETKTLIGTKEGHVVVMTVGSEEYTIDGEEKEMSIAPLILEGRVFASARYVAEAFGYEVNWDKDELIVRIEAKKKTEEKTEKKEEEKAEKEPVTEATTKAPVTETTTKAPELVSSVSPALFNKVSEDLKIAFDGYTLGTADNNNRFKIATVKQYKASWDEAASTSADKKFVSYSKILYDRMINTAKRIDYVYNRSKYRTIREIADDCRENKALLKEYVYDFFECETMDQCKAVTDELQTFYNEIKTKYPEYE